MSGGCGCGQPVILNNPAAGERVDVETQLLCDVLPDGTTAARVLVAEIYDASSGDGIGRRVSNLATGAPYDVQGELRQCDDGCTRQIVERCGCDQTPDGIVRYIELWAVAACGSSDPVLVGRWLDGDFEQPYTPTSPVACPGEDPDDMPLVLGEVCYDDGTGTVRRAAAILCATCSAPTYRDVESGAEVTDPAIVPCPAMRDCETEQLCDVQRSVPAVLPSFGTPDRRWHDLPNGVRWMKRGSDSAAPAGWYTADSGTPERFDFDRPVSIRYTVRFSGPTAVPLRIPAGWYLDGLNVTQHAWDATTRTISPTSSATQAGESTFRIVPQAVQTMTAPVLTAAQTSGQSSQYGQITVTADLVTPFLRTVCRDELGTATVTDTELDAVTVYEVVGTVGLCEPPPAPVQTPCTDCETLLLCDVSTLPPATISGTAASGTLANGVNWTATNAAPAAGNRPWAPQRTNASGAWWGLPAFPHGQTDPNRWTFSRPSTVEFSVYVRYNAANPAINWAQLPANLDVVSLPYGYSYDPVTGVLTRTADGDPADPCAYMTDPQIATAARFRTAGPVTELITQPAPNSRVAVCGTFMTYWVGALTVAPGGPFLRRICRDCDGAVTSITDTRLDGTTQYVPAGTVGVCEPRETCSDCETQQLCDRLTSNPGYEATIVPTNGQSSGTTETGVTWSAADPDDNPVSFNRAGADGYWVGIQTYPTASAGPFTWTFSDPVTVEFGIVLVPPSTGTVTMPLPPGVRPVSLPTGYTYDAAANSLVSAVPNASGGPGCQALANPSRAVAARFVTKGPVTSLTIDTPQAQPVCGQVGMSRVGGFVLNPEATPFLRTVCRDCDGKVLSVTDTAVDGTTRYTPIGEVVDCAQAQQDSGQLDGPHCEYITLCDTLPPQRIKGGTFPSAASFAADWAHTGAAQWVSGNGPDGTAGFVDFSPGNAYGNPSIEQTATVVPGVAHAFSCQFGVWGAGGTEQPRGRVEIFDGAGTVLFTQDVAPTIGGGITWPANGRVGPVVITATDDTMRVLLTDISSGAGGDQQFQIDLTVDNVSLLAQEDVSYPFLRRLCTDADGNVTRTDTELDGATEYLVSGTAGVCSSSSDASPVAEQAVSTGARSVTGTAPVDLAAEFPGLQSVTLLVTAGTVNVTMTSGTAVPIPAGTTATWSVTRDQDAALDAAAFAGADANSAYLLLWTYEA